MGKNSKARRAAKQRQRQRAQAPSQRRGGGGNDTWNGSGGRPDGRAGWSGPDPRPDVPNAWAGRPAASRPDSSAFAAHGESARVAERAAALLVDAQNRLCFGDPSFEQALARLDALNDSDGSHPGSTAVETALVRQLRYLWPSGWQPVDIERLARRELNANAAAIAVDAIAAEHAEFPGRTVDARWSAQLDRLESRPWWDAGPSGRLQQWAAKAGHTRIEALRAAVELLHALGHAPKLRLWMPYPGASADVLARFARSAPVPDSIDRKMLERVRALLAKAESTSFPEEAESLSAKAQQLMARHSIDEALVSAKAGGSKVPGGRRLPIDDPYAGPKAALINNVANANRSRAVWNKELGFAEVLGFESDLDVVELLSTSLLIQATAAMSAAGTRTTRAGVSRTRSFRQSFLMAYASRIGERLREATSVSVQEATAEHGDALLPVLARRDDAVTAYVDELFPNMRSVRTSINNAEGWAAGRLAADQASLGPGDNRRLSAG